MRFISALPQKVNKPNQLLLPTGRTERSMSETPERKGRSSRAGSRPGSRSATPHRARSKTPVRTPTRRRRATIVSANLVSSRRHRQSVSPLNILRNLSRALVRDRPEELVQQHELEQEQEDERLPSHDDDFFDAGEDMERVPLDFEDQENKDPNRLRSPMPTSSLLPDLDSDAHREPLSELNLRSTLLSDIALPEGMMHDEEEGEQDDSMVQQHPPTDPFMSDSELQERRPPHTPPTPPHTETKKPDIKGVRNTTRTMRNPLTSKMIFKYAQSCTKKPLAKECASLISEISSEFFDNVTEDLEAYSEHSKAKDTINAKSALLLLKRQRLCHDWDSMVDLVDEVMPLEDLFEVKRNEKKFR